MHLVPRNNTAMHGLVAVILALWGLLGLAFLTTGAPPAVPGSHAVTLSVAPGVPGQVLLTVHAPAAVAYTIEATRDFSSWTPILQSRGVGHKQTFPIDAREPWMFFRLQLSRRQKRRRGVPGQAPKETQATCKEVSQPPTAFFVGKLTALRRAVRHLFQQGDWVCGTHDLASAKLAWKDLSHLLGITFSPDLEEPEFVECPEEAKVNPAYYFPPPPAGPFIGGPDSADLKGDSCGDPACKVCNPADEDLGADGTNERPTPPVTLDEAVKALDRLAEQAKIDTEIGDRLANLSAEIYRRLMPRVEADPSLRERFLTDQRTELRLLIPD